MNARAQINLFGSLKKSGKTVIDQPIEIPLQEPTPLTEVLNVQNIPLAGVRLAMVNHKAVSVNCVIHPGDRVSLFPREYPIFADWRDFFVEKP